MNEKLNEQRFFSESAKEAGIEKDTRMMFTEDPSLFFDDMSPEFKSRLTPEILQDMFKVLAGRANGVDERSIRDVGETLYRFRGDIEDYNRPTETIPERDRPKVSLSCSLIENSVYQGRLVSLTKEQMASLAFTINVVGKLFVKGKAEGVKGFDQLKFDHFISDVEDYAGKELFGEAQYVKGDSQATLEKNRVAVEAGLVEVQKGLEDIVPRIRPEIEGLYEKVVQAYEIIKESGVTKKNMHTEYAFRGLNDIAYSLDQLRGHMRVKISSYHEGVAESAIQTIKEKRYSFTAPKFDPGRTRLQTLSRMSEEEIHRQIALLKGDERLSDEVVFYSEVNRGFKYLIKLLKEAAPKTEPEQKKKEAPKTFNSFQTLGKVVAEDRILEAIKILEDLGEQKVGVVFEMNALIEKARNIVDNQKEVLERNYFFQSSVGVIKNQPKGPTTVAYGFKSLLIAADMMRRDYAKGKNVAILKDIPEHDLKGKFKDPRVHAFMGERKRRYEYDDDTYYDPGPEYAQLHFIPAHIPFSVYAWNYLKSKASKTSK